MSSSRRASAATGMLLLRGSSASASGAGGGGALGVRLSRSVDANKSEAGGESETLGLVVDFAEGAEVREPAKEAVAAAVRGANERREAGARVVVMDVPLGDFAASGLDFDFAKYTPPPAMNTVRLAVVPGLAVTAVAFEAGKNVPQDFVADVKQVGEITLKGTKWSKQKRTITMSLEVAPGADVPLAPVVPGKLDGPPGSCRFVALDGSVSVDASFAASPTKASAGAAGAAAAATTAATTTAAPAASAAGATATTTTTTPDDTKNQVVTPWEVEAGADGVVDYNRLLVEFGCQPIDDALLARFEKVTGARPHPWLRRGIFFSHRDLDILLNAVEKKEPVYLYTGRGPSSEALHFGHLIPFMFTKWLHDVLKCPLVIQMTDDEKFLWKDLTLEETNRLGYENAKDILAVGFDPSRTFIFLNTEYMGHMYPLVCEIQKRVTLNQARGIFGFEGQDAIGKIAFPAIQAAPSFSRCFPVVLGHPNAWCLIPCAIDQDPYFRMTRDVAKRLHLKGPSLIHSKFFPGLAGPQAGGGGKMSSSVGTAVMVTDDRETIKRKIREHAFSGGRVSWDDQQKLGADLDKDVPYQWLRFFLLDDDELADVARLYGPGELRPGEQRWGSDKIKTKLADVLAAIAENHQRARAAITSEMMAEVFRVRKIS